MEATGDGFTTSREGATAFWGLLKRKSQREWRLAEKVLKDAFEWAREKMNLPLASVRDDFYPDFPIMRFQQGLSDPSGIRTLSPSTR